MFKPQKPKPTTNQPIRHKLPLVERPPKQEDIATLFTNAQRIRGGIFEMPIKPNPGSPTFLMTCQVDLNANETVWAMSAEDGTVLWSAPQSDLDLVFDMVVMACQPRGSSAQMPPELAPSRDSQQAPPQQNYQNQQQAQQPYQQQQQQAPYQQQQQYQGQAAPYQQQQYPQQGQQYPQQGGQGYPPNSFGQPYPNQAPNQAPYQQGYPQQQQYSAPAPAQTPPWTGPAPSSSTPTPAYPEINNFIDLLSKGQPNLLLGHLFVEAGIVPERCLDAALKLQEMVRDGKLNDGQAILALKRASELGGSLTEEVIQWAKDPEKMKKPTSGGGASSSAPASKPPSTSKPGMDAATLARVIDLLKQAQLVSEADVETASKVRSKHGGDIGQILVSAGKIGGKTLEAAAECSEYMRFGRLRVDKAIMALHYCERMRAGLKDAFDELSITLE